MIDKEYIKKTLDLALKAKGQTSPNPLVGALVVKNNRVIGQGYHHRCGGPHAEVIAIRKAGRRARDAKLYLNLEPCFHQGRTPPCVDKVIDSGVKEVVIGIKDPNPLTNGKSIRKLKRHGIKTKVGFLQSECERVNEPFIKYVKKKMPFVVAKCAQTLDGKIATATGQSKWITSPKTRQFARRLRDEFDAIMVGANTAIKDNPSLNAAKRNKKIKKIIVDSTLRISPRANIFKKTKPSDCYLATTRRAHKSKLKLLKDKGINVIICPERAGRVNLTWLLRTLAKHQITNILIEGGSTIVGNALKEKLVDKMHIYVAPKVFGDQRALSSIKGIDITNVNRSVNLKNIEVKKIGEDLFIQGYVHGTR